MYNGPAGVIISALVFGWKMASIKMFAKTDTSGAKVYQVSGPLFFGSMSHFVDQFDYKNDLEAVIIDFTHSHVWDHSAVAGIAKVTSKYEKINKTVTIVGLNSESKRMIERIGLSTPSRH